MKPNGLRKPVEKGKWKENIDKKNENIIEMEDDNIILT